MLTAQDLIERLHIDAETLGYLHAKRITPEPIRVGGVLRWRVEDIELFEEYLVERLAARDNGVDPDSEAGPAVPVYSQGIPALDPRHVAARIRERDRRSKSRTLQNGTQPIEQQQPVVLPEIKTETQAKG